MPLFEIKNSRLARVPLEDFSKEKLLQELIEGNLPATFNCRFVASEYSTGARHGGRIDTLALSEDSNPVIIEYKKTASSALITQSLYYLDWIRDHQGDFEIAVQKVLEKSIKVDWSDIRVICLAPAYSKYDLHAVTAMGANIELWTHRLFHNSCLYLEETLRPQGEASSARPNEKVKDPKWVKAGKKAAVTRASGEYTFEQHLESKPERIRSLALAIDEVMMSLDPAIERSPRKLYVAYRMSQNIACMEVQKSKLLLYLKLNPAKTKNLPTNTRDVSKIGHYGTGNLEFTLRNTEDVDSARHLIEKAYREVGG